MKIETFQWKLFYKQIFSFFASIWHQYHMCVLYGKRSMYVHVYRIYGIYIFLVRSKKHSAAWLCFRILCVLYWTNLHKTKQKNAIANIWHTDCQNKRKLKPLFNWPEWELINQGKWLTNMCERVIVWQNRSQIRHTEMSNHVKLCIFVTCGFFSCVIYLAKATSVRCRLSTAISQCEHKHIWQSWTLA